MTGHAPVELLSPSGKPIQLMGGVAAVICVMRCAVFFVLLPAEGSLSPVNVTSLNWFVPASIQT